MSLKHVPPSLCHHRTLSLTSASALTCIDHMTPVFQALQNPFFVNNNHSAIKLEPGKLERNPKHIHQKLICYSKPILTSKSPALQYETTSLCIPIWSLYPMPILIPHGQLHHLNNGCRSDVTYNGYICDPIYGNPGTSASLGERTSNWFAGRCVILKGPCGTKGWVQHSISLPWSWDS